MKTNFFKIPFHLGLLLLNRDIQNLGFLSQRFHKQPVLCSDLPWATLYVYVSALGKVTFFFHWNQRFLNISNIPPFYFLPYVICCIILFSFSESVEIFPSIRNEIALYSSIFKTYIWKMFLQYQWTHCPSGLIIGYLTNILWCDVSQL